MSRTVCLAEPRKLGIGVRALTVLMEPDERANPLAVAEGAKHVAADSGVVRGEPQTTAGGRRYGSLPDAARDGCDIRQQHPASPIEKPDALPVNRLADVVKQPRYPQLFGCAA